MHTIIYTLQGEYLQYQRQRWETEQLLASSNQPLPAFSLSPRVLDQELIPAPAPHLSVATKFPAFPANVSYNTQGALNEPPLDVSNIMNGSDGNVKWQALHPN
ncbi:hypothetical protein DSO57_1038926 [Entomophthora muscae]|uniref:Uncharacterized protein n=1 Tax=Entomophthora muscae TaxID=34485 RepID=A0ACC2SBK3_9FUNG|nr:hypothetical protein DSO57_1038926 [Entomophthora muscae]